MEAGNRQGTVDEALKLVPAPVGKYVEMYPPHRLDPQQPHTRDGASVVARGHGEFVNGGVRSTLGIGDFLFVPAGIEHQFENLSDDFAVWVLFYGPDGGGKA